MDNEKINNLYSIDGCKNKNLNYHYNSNFSLLQKKPYKKFKDEFEAFKKDLINKYNNNLSLTYIHLGDGDVHFLKKESYGSAAVGKRALSIPYEKFDITPFYEGFNKNTHICIEVLKHSLLDKFNKLYPNNIISGKGVKRDYNSNRKSIPTEFLYGIISNKWIFKNFDSIGLIGADEKIILIKKLMQFKEYQEYLGIKNFDDYITIPQKFACDNLNKVRKSIKTQLKKSKSKIFLVGIGHVKSGLFHLMKDYKKAIYLDIGCYIDALAGMIDYKRPYAHDWINYKIKKYDYSKIDDLQYEPKFEKYLD